jgi:hypothetical protein
MSTNSEVVEVYKGIEIRKCNKIRLTFSASAFKYLILESERTNIPITKLLIFSSKPCEKCTNMDVVVFNKDGNEFKIKRGILSRHVPENTGRGIIQQAHEQRNRNSRKD